MYLQLPSKSNFNEHTCRLHFEGYMYDVIHYLFHFQTDQPKEMTEETRVVEAIEKVLESLTEKTSSWLKLETYSEILIYRLQINNVLILGINPIKQKMVQH